MAYTKFCTVSPDNIVWAFSAADQRLLRHLPDVAVRPGSSIEFGINHGSFPLSPEDSSIEAHGLQLNVEALLESVPWGAPVRINLELFNTTNEHLPAPASLSMKTGYVAGRVIDQAGVVRTFSTVVRHLDELNLQVLQPGQRLKHSQTLLRGPQGALFPSPGIYQLQVYVTWDIDGYIMQVSGETTIMVTPAFDEAHAKAAMKVLSTPNALLTLAIGGDHLEDGVEAIQNALKNPVLRPHFAYIEAKRLAQRFGERKADASAAAGLIDETSVMSPSEIEKVAKIAQSQKAESEYRKTFAKTLKGKINVIETSREVKDLVNSL